MLRLLTHSKIPPGGFYFVQRYVDANGRKWRKDWETTSEIQTLTIRVSQFRIANNMARADKASVLEDIDIFTASRLGKSAWTVDVSDNVSFAQLHPNAIPSAGCPSCGLPMTTI